MRRGIFASARLSGARRSGVPKLWSRVTGLGTAGRFSTAFAASFLMQMGARIADGCTSGHGLSGMAQLSLGSFAAVTAMFAGGIATALLVFRPVR